MRYLFAFIVISVAVDLTWSWGKFLRGKNLYSLGEPNLSKGQDLPEEKWFMQNLDHFDPTNTEQWRQRYFMNEVHYNGGPVFLMIGGEGEASAKWMVEGQWIEYAKQYGALCFQLEHRYYGKSHPTSDLSVKNLVYLNSQQALADIAYFIEGMKLLHQIPRDKKWIVFGGSYPGSLAAWVRMKYPYFVHGAVSSSGPLLAKVDFQEYYVIVEKALATHSQACVDAIADANTQINWMLHHPVGKKNLNIKFKLCDTIDHPDVTVKDISNFYETVAGNFAEVVQYNKDNRNSSKALNLTIDTVCDILVNQSKGIPVDRLAEVSNLMLTANKEKCLDYRYSKMINELRNVSWEAEMSEGGRQWFYQTCTEFGFFQTSTARPDLFSTAFEVDFFIQQCSDVFGSKYDKELVEYGVERTNVMYGGLKLEESNIVYVHGSIDPWHALGITKSTNPQAPAIYIDGTAHCANMYPAASSDLPALIDARNKVGSLIGDWLKQ